MQQKIPKNTILSALIGAFIVFFLLSPDNVFAALPAGFEVETVVGGLELPGSMAFTADGRIFVAEKGGTVRVVKNGALLPQPLIQLTDVNAYGDRGLLSIAVDPNFSTNGYLYLLYTYENTPGTDYAGEKTGRLVRVTVVGDTADESTKTVILGSIGGNLATPSCENYAVTADCIPSDSPSHSTGGMRFGTDGKLYLTLGDGAHFQYVDPRSMRAQNLDSLGGKVLRINTDGTGVAGNPFYTGNPNDNRSKVYAYGMRNAFRLDFRPSNGSLFAGDVGWDTWEEVDKIVPGGNYGWPCREGNFQTPGQSCTANPRIDPVYAYAHDVNGAGAVVAGAFATAYPASYANSLFIGDYAQDWIKIVNFDAADNFVSVQDFMTGADGAMGPVSLDRGPDGNIYYIAIYTGELRRILYTTGNRQPNAVIAANPTNGLAPLTVNFSSAGSSDPDINTLSYSWAFGDGTTSTLPNPTHQYASNGTYVAVLTVTDGQGGLNTKSITVTVGNRAPTAVITSPLTGALYKAGDVINLAGHGTDPEDGTITATNKLTWSVILHHNTHIHILQTLTGPNPSFTAPDHTGATDVYTEVQLTVADAGGLTNAKSINLYLDNDLPVAGNLIQNPSLEDANPFASTLPQYWIQGGYGVNDGVYTYPVAGLDGTDAAKVSVTNYTDGDAKWFHDPVSVNPNTVYTFSGYYKSNVPVSILAQIGYGDGTYTYPLLGAQLPVATNWTRIDRTFTTPATAQTAVVTIPLDRIGEITIDNFSLTQGLAPTDTTPPSVSLTAPASGATVSGTVSLSANATDAGGVTDVKFVVDGTTVTTDTTNPYSFAWNTLTIPNGSHTLTAVARDAAGNTATSSPITVTVNNIVTPPPAGNLIDNPSVETGSVSPTNWFQGKWGTNTTVFSYPVAGFDGAKAIRVQTTAYTSGDAKWYFKDVPVTPGVAFQYSSYYQSNVTTSLLARYTLANGTFSYITIASTVPISATWKQLSYSVVPPPSTVSVTVFHVLSKVGTLTTDLFSIAAPGSTDTTPPSVSLTAPASGATVSGTTTLTATATDASGIQDVKFMVDSAVVHTDTTAPYSFAWSSVSIVNGSHTVRAIARDTIGNTATSSVVAITVQNGSTTTPDTIPPSVSLTAPASGATVSGTVTLSANATDASGVAGVKFYVDNTLSGLEDTTAPYSVSLNTATLSNGNHSFFAVARDLAGNSATTSPNTITVQNSTATTTGPNLIVNGSFETTGTGGNPQGWNRGGWGTNTTSYVYPIVGRDGNKAARVSTTAYTSGDMKWFPTDVPMQQGKVYTFSSWYKSNTISDVIGRYTLTDGSYHYFGVIKEIQPVANWTFFSATFIPPDNAVSFTPLHLISSVGFLETDDVSLTVTGSGTSTNDTTAPIVKIVSPLANATVSGTINVVASSTDNIGVTYVMFAVNGTPVTGNEITTSPYTYVWNTASVPNGTHTLKATTHDAAGNNSTDTITVTVNNVGTPTDTTPPSVSLTAPASGATVSGMTTLSANATDASGVVDVKFIIDGTTVHTDTTSPYSFAWNSTSVVNGNHTIVATTVDTAGNTATSTPITVTVSNAVVPPPSVNLINNPSLETGGATPTNWSQGNWGTNTTVFTYPTPGTDGANAAQVSMTAYTDGDAKWFFKPVAVTAGASYTYSNYYRATVPTTRTARYTRADGSFLYGDLDTVPATATWNKAEAVVIIPVGITEFTVFHHIKAIGELSVDQYSLTLNN